MLVRCGDEVSRSFMAQSSPRARSEAIRIPQAPARARLAVTQNPLAGYGVPVPIPPFGPPAGYGVPGVLALRQIRFNPLAMDCQWLALG